MHLRQGCRSPVFTLGGGHRDRIVRCSFSPIATNASATPTSTRDDRLSPLPNRSSHFSLLTSHFPPPATVNPHAPHFSPRQYATIYTALGWLRGALYDVATGDFDKEQIQRLIESTSLARLSEISGIAEDDLAIDYHPHLTEREYHAIGGARWPE